MNVAFLGLGVMGYPMAGHLATAGFSVQVYNRTFSKAQKWAAEHAGQALATIAEAVAGADAVFLCVGDDADVRDVVTEALPALKSGAVVVDHTTTSAALAREMNTLCADNGIHWLDAPVSGGQAGAENGQLTVMVGGQPEAYDKVSSALDSFSKRHRLMGEAGQGQLTKMVNQICIAGLVQGLAEGLSFAQAAGLDGEAVVEVISQGAAQSWQMENRYKTMLAGDYDLGFAVEWMRKDLGHCLNEARTNGSALPVTALVNQFYAEVESMGGSRWDTSSLLARLEKMRNA